MRVETFYDDRQVEGTVIAGPTDTGLYRVRLDDGRTVIRHRDRLKSLDEEARQLLR